MPVKIEIKTIPAMPQVILEVLRFDPNSSNADSSTLDRILRIDKGITTNVMRVANSAYFGQSGRIKTLKDAITLMGLKSTRNLVILKTASDMFGKLRSPDFRLMLHESAVVTALATIDLARPLGLNELREEAFLYGLLHNVGMSVIALNATKEYEKLLAQYLAGAGEIKELEEKALGITHQEVGLKVFEEWKIPEEFHPIVQNYDFAPDEIDGIGSLHKLVSLSILAVRRILALTDDSSAPAREEAILKSFGKDKQVSSAINGEYYNLIQEHPFYQLALEF